MLLLSNLQRDYIPSYMSNSDLLDLKLFNNFSDKIKHVPQYEPGLTCRYLLYEDISGCLISSGSFKDFLFFFRPLFLYFFLASTTTEI